MKERDHKLAFFSRLLVQVAHAWTFMSHLLKFSTTEVNDM